MPLRQPHEYRIRKGSKAIDMVRENVIRRFHVARQLRVGTAADGSRIYDPNPKFHDPILYQDGKFYFENGVEIAKKEVPPYILEQLRKHPPEKSQVLGFREVRMTVEEAEAEFGDPSLDSRIVARQAQESEEEEPRPARQRRPRKVHRRRTAARR